MAEKRAVFAAQHSCEALSMARYAAVADGVNGVMNPMKAPCRRCVSDVVLRITQRGELPR